MGEPATSEDITAAIDGLVDCTNDAERRLEAFGEPDAHAWMFGLREVLLDLRRILPLIATLPSAADEGRARERVREIAGDFVYGMAPHATHHLGEVLEMIDSQEDQATEEPPE